MKNTKKITFSAIISALAVAIMYVGALIEVLDLSTAAIASICVTLALTEIGTKYAFLSYACIGVLSFLLLPTKYAPVMFIGFLGYYPMAKAFFERKFQGILCLVLKFVLLNASVLTMVGIIYFTVGYAAEALWFEIMLLVLANVVFVVYDVALTRLLRAYVLVWRRKLKIKF